MILTLNDHEDPKLRGEPQFHRFYVQYQRVYNVPFDLYTLIPSRGEAKADLTSPLINPASGVQTPRALSVKTERQADDQAMVRVIVDWYQVLLYAGENTTSPSELNSSREGDDTGHHRVFKRYYVSTDSPFSSGIADGTEYPDDTWAEEERLKTSETTDTDTLPGMGLQTLNYLGYKDYD